MITLDELKENDVDMAIAYVIQQLAIPPTYAPDAPGDISNIEEKRISALMTDPKSREEFWRRFGDVYYKDRLQPDR